MGQAVLAQFEADHGIAEDQLEKMTYIPLDGEGAIDGRVDKLFKQYLSRPDWIADMRRADAIFFAAHSQGCIVTSHIIARLISQGHIRTKNNADAVARCEWAFGPIILPAHAKATAYTGDTGLGVMQPQKVAFLAMCGVHHGPFYSSTTSAVVQPYLWFESTAAKELFEFQDTSSAVSEEYHRSLSAILESEVKCVFLASLDDQMVSSGSSTQFVAVKSRVCCLIRVGFSPPLFCTGPHLLFPIHFRFSPTPHPTPLRRCQHPRVYRFPNKPFGSLLNDA